MSKVSQAKKFVFRDCFNINLIDCYLWEISHGQIKTVQVPHLVPESDFGHVCPHYPHYCSIITTITMMIIKTTSVALVGILLFYGGTVSYLCSWGWRLHHSISNSSSSFSFRVFFFSWLLSCKTNPHFRITQTEIFKPVSTGTLSSSACRAVAVALTAREAQEVHGQYIQLQLLDPLFTLYYELVH